MNFDLIPVNILKDYCVKVSSYPRG